MKAHWLRIQVRTVCCAVHDQSSPQISSSQTVASMDQWICCKEASAPRGPQIEISGLTSLTLDALRRLKPSWRIAQQVSIYPHIVDSRKLCDRQFEGQCTSIIVCSNKVSLCFPTHYVNFAGLLAELGSKICTA